MSKQKNKVAFNDFLSGHILLKSWIVKNKFLIVLFVVLSIVYIKNTYRTENLLYEITILQKDIKILRNRSIDYTVKLQELGREHQVKKILEEENIELVNIQKPLVEIVADEQ